MTQRLTTWQFSTEAELLAAGENTGVEVGDLAYAVDTNKIYSSTDPSVPTWQEVTGALPPEAVKVTQETYTLDSLAVIADSHLPVPGPGISQGWHYDNIITSQPNPKINWYFYSSDVNPGVITLAELEGQYALVSVTTITDPIFFTVYTKPEGAGDAGSFYRSRLNYIQPNPAVSTPTPGVYLFHRSDLDVTNIYPGYPRVACAFDAGTSNGPQAATEEILLQAISTNSTAANGSLDFEVEQTGYQSTNDGRANFTMVANDYQPRLEFLAQGLPVDLKQFSKVTWGEGGGGPNPNPFEFPLCTATGAMITIIMPSGNPNIEVQFNVHPAMTLLGPDGQLAPIGGSSLSYPAGTFPPGTVLTFTGTPTIANLAQVGSWTLLNNYVQPSSAESQTWSDTLALGEKTAGISPAIQQSTPFSKADPRDQVHWNYPGAGLPNAGPLPNDGSVPDADSTRAYTIPVYSDPTPVDGSGGQVSGGIIYDGGDALVMVDVYLVANYMDGSALNNGFNKYYHSRLMINTRDQSIDQFGPLEGDTSFFDLVVDPPTGKIAVAFNDDEPTATGNVVIHGFAHVIPVALQQLA